VIAHRYAKLAVLCIVPEYRDNLNYCRRSGRIELQKRPPSFLISMKRPPKLLGRDSESSRWSSLARMSPFRPARGASSFTQQGQDAGRVEIKGDPDGAVKLRRAFKITALGKPRIAPPPAMPSFNNNDLIGIEIVDAVDARLASALDVAPNAAEMQQRVRAVAAMWPQARKRERLLPRNCARWSRSSRRMQ